MKPMVAIMMGDPAGIGPEILLRAWHEDELSGRFFAIGEYAALKLAQERLGIDIPVHIIRSLDEMVEGELNLIDTAVFREESIPIGKVDARTGEAAWKAIDLAAQMALRREVDALVSLPVNKEAVQVTHPGFVGHAHMLAKMCRRYEYTVMLRSERLTVTMVSSHIPLAEAIDLARTARVFAAIRQTHEAMLTWVEHPRIAVAGLNPHAGEGGLFGKEEIEEISPAVRRARLEGLNVTGPISPDIVFRQALTGMYDAVVCMYHDQGHIPMKLLDFYTGVDITLGLPITCVAVDHGTAFDIAYQGAADTGSFVHAYQTACILASARG